MLDAILCDMALTCLFVLVRACVRACDCVRACTCARACVQNAKSEDPKDAGSIMVGRLVDCIETAYNQASEMCVDDLAGISVVLEKCSSTPVCEFLQP